MLSSSHFYKFGIIVLIHMRLISDQSKEDTG